jgi:hypothetical protein
MNSDRLIFIHIPKAAGQTMNSIVSRQYRRDEIFHVEGGIGKARIPSSEVAKEAKLVVGHVHFGIDRELPGASTYITMLRNPVDRVLSLFRYIASTPQHSLHGRLGTAGLLDFVTGSVDAEEIENGQTRQIAGVRTGSPDEDSLALAKQHLQERFLAVGLVERFDESMLMFKRRLHWRMPYYVPKNVIARTSMEEPTAEAIEVIESRNALDLELYRYACDLFEEEIRQEGPLFHIELSAFRLLNSAARFYRGFRG